MSDSRSTLIPSHRYHDAPAAIDWLCTAFGFERQTVIEGENGVVYHAQLTLGNGMIMLGTGKDDEFGRLFKTPDELGGAETSRQYIVVADADAVHERAVAAGAVVVQPLQDTPFGSRTFTVKDPEGHTWTVGTFDPWAKRE